MRKYVSKIAHKSAMFHLTKQDFVPVQLVCSQLR